MKGRACVHCAPRMSLHLHHGCGRSVPRVRHCWSTVSPRLNHGCMESMLSSACSKNAAASLELSLIALPGSNRKGETLKHSGTVRCLAIRTVILLCATLLH